MSEESKNHIKEQVLNIFQIENDGLILDKITELAANISICIAKIPKPLKVPPSSLDSFDSEFKIDIDSEDFWYELFTIWKKFIRSENEERIMAGLNVYKQVIKEMEREIKEKDPEFYHILNYALCNKNLNIGLKTLQVLREFISHGYSEYPLSYSGLLDSMLEIPVNALENKNHEILRDSLTEFVLIAESQPIFFLNDFDGLFNVFRMFISKTDEFDETIKWLPIEFLKNIAKGIPSLFEDNPEYVKVIINAVFKLMINIDDEVNETWKDPKDSTQAEEDFEKFIISFGTVIISDLCVYIDKSIMFPLIKLLFEKNVLKRDEWKYKSAGLAAFPHVGELWKDINPIKSMIPTVIDH